MIDHLKRFSTLPDIPIHKPSNEEEIAELESRIVTLNEELQKEIQNNIQLQNTNQTLRKDLLSSIDHLRDLELSLAYRLGKIILFIPNYIFGRITKLTNLEYQFSLISYTVNLLGKYPHLFLRKFSIPNLTKFYHAILAKEPEAFVRRNIFNYIAGYQRSVPGVNDHELPESIKLQIDRMVCYEDHFEILGWIVSNIKIKSIWLERNNVNIGTVHLGLFRPDVSILYRSYQFHKNVGFQFNTILKGISSADDIYLHIEDNNNFRYQKKLNLQLENINSQYRSYLERERKFKHSINVKSSNYKISLIVYNSIDDLTVIERCISAVLNCMTENITLYVVNNCPKDHVKLFINSYADNFHSTTHTTKSIDFYYQIQELIESSDGDYIFFLPSHYELNPNALQIILHSLFLTKDALPGIIYFDTDEIDENFQRTSPRFKPSFSYDYLLSSNYIGDIFLISTFTFRDKIIADSDLGSQFFYDILLQCLDREVKFMHLPQVLAHSRIRESLYAPGADALNKYLNRNNITGSIEEGLIPNTYFLKRDIIHYPKVSIIIPFRDEAKLLKQCIESIFKFTSYPDFEIILISNNSIEEETGLYLEWLTTHNGFIRAFKLDIPFNYSKINNWAATIADGEILLFLNNDTEVISSNWLTHMVTHIQRSNVGAVGCKLLFQDSTIQHSGVVLNISGLPAHGHKYYDAKENGYMGRINITQNYSACTGACLMVKKDLFQRLGGFDEINLKIALNDIDLCLKIREAGFLIVYTPFTVLFHYESKTRGADDNVEKLLRARRENQYFRNQWALMMEKGDPYYNPNLTHERTDFSLNLQYRYTYDQGIHR